MKELTDLTIKDLLSSNTSTNTLIINQNFAQVKASILLLQSTFGIEIQTNTIGTPRTKIFVGQVSADKMYLPNIGNANNTGNARITFDGSDGSIKASGLVITNNIYGGNDVIVGDRGKGGRLLIYQDKTTETGKPGRLGDVRFIGSDFQGYAVKNETPATFAFTITGGSNTGTISVKLNGGLVASTAWAGSITITVQNLVAAIQAALNQYVTASYSLNTVTIESTPGYAEAVNGATIDVNTTLITVDTNTGTMLGGVDGVKQWVTFGEGGVAGPTGPTGPPGGSSGTSGSAGTAGSAGSSGTSGSSGQNGTSGSAGLNGSSGSAGTSGSSGADGDIGLQGLQGDAGSSGSSGANGTSGSAGTSGTSPLISSISSFDVKLGDPSTSGYPAWTTGFFTQWNNTTYMSGEAFSDLNQLLKLLAPSSAPLLNTIDPFVLSSYYPAPPTGTINRSSNGATTGNTRISDDDTASVLLTNMTTNPGTSGGGFAKEPVNTLTALIDSVNVGDVLYSGQVITPGLTIDNQLKVTEYDYWSGVAGKAGIWPALLAEITTFFNGLSYSSHTAELSWVSGGTNKIGTFWYDNPVNPSFNTLVIDTGAAGTNYISGVPSLAASDSIGLTGAIDDGVSQFYYSNPLYIAIPGAEATISTPPSTLSGAQTNPLVCTAVLSVAANKYTEDLVVSATGYNAKGTTISELALDISSSYSGKVMRIDTVSNETSRVYSGGVVGQYPISGYGTSYTASTDLTSGGYRYELQMINGKYQRLTGIDYGDNYPVAGPDYSSEPNTSWRYVTFSLAVVGAVGFTITINDAVGFTADPTTKVTAGNIRINAILIGSPTSTWVNCNAPYDGVSNPGSTIDGDASMVVGSSTATFKRCTFGTTSRSGTLYVRIGLDYGETMKFGNISLAQI